ncbi:MAG: stage IV sporulation protein A, partial [Clostridia bacterium]|nr:stage IV sporulation protein A [Clostridia bacterium]
STAAKIIVAEGAEASVRFVDCVGYTVEGAGGFEEEGQPRLVNTPWSEEPLPFERAAELGTEKVIKEHSTVGVLVTTDGSVTDIPRENYLPAEERTVRELKALGKPFIVLLNCKSPNKAEGLCAALQEKYDAPVVAINVEKMTKEDIDVVLRKTLLEFPVVGIDVKIPGWLQIMPEDYRRVQAIKNALKKSAERLKKMKDCLTLENLFDAEDDFVNPSGVQMDLGAGTVEISIEGKEGLFYRVLSEESGAEISGEAELFALLKNLSAGKKDYDKVKNALAQAADTGYGIVQPAVEEYVLSKPKLIKKGQNYGVEFSARAQGYHFVKVDWSGEVCTIIGGKEQCERFYDETLQKYEEDAGQVWDINIFGKTLREMLGDSLRRKGDSVSQEMRGKLRRTVNRIVDEQKNNGFFFLF